MNVFDLLTFEWFLPKALIGLAVGFVLRVLEDYAWLKSVNRQEKLFFWSIVVLTPVHLRGVARSLSHTRLVDSQLPKPRVYYCFGILASNTRRFHRRRFT